MEFVGSQTIVQGDELHMLHSEIGAKHTNIPVPPPPQVLYWKQTIAAGSSTL